MWNNSKWKDSDSWMNEWKVQSTHMSYEVQSYNLLIIVNVVLSPLNPRWHQTNQASKSTNTIQYNNNTTTPSTLYYRLWLWNSSLHLQNNISSFLGIVVDWLSWTKAWVSNPNISRLRSIQSLITDVGIGSPTETSKFL